MDRDYDANSILEEAYYNQKKREEKAIATLSSLNASGSATLLQLREVDHPSHSCVFFNFTQNSVEIILSNISGMKMFHPM